MISRQQIASLISGSLYEYPTPEQERLCDHIAGIITFASTRQEPAPAADADEVASKLEALGNTLSSRAKQYAGCSWLPDPSRPVADSMPGMWEYRQAALCAEAATALRRYAGDGGVTGCWLEEESRAVGRHVALCGVHLSDEEKLLFRSGWRAALRRPITDAQVSAASEAYLVERDGGFVPDMRAALEAAARAKSGEKGGAG